MTQTFKSDAKLTKMNLLTSGRIISDTIDKVIKLNNDLDNYTNEIKIFEEDVIKISTRFLDEALEDIQKEIGRLELEEAGKKK